MRIDRKKNTSVQASADVGPFKNERFSYENPAWFLRGITPAYNQLQRPRASFKHHLSITLRPKSSKNREKPLSEIQFPFIKRKAVYSIKNVPCINMKKVIELLSCKR